MLPSRIIVDVVIPDSLERAVKLDGKSGLASYGAFCDRDYRQGSAARDTSDEKWKANFDRHMQGWLRLGKICHLACSLCMDRSSWEMFCCRLVTYCPTVSRVWKTHMDCMENTHYCVIYTNFRGLVYQICVVHTTFNQINLKNIVNHTKCVKSTKRWSFAVACGG